MNIAFRLSLLTILCCTFFLGCDNPQRNVDALRHEIIAFKNDPSAAKQTSIETNFAKLEKQIDELDKNGKEDEAAALRSQLYDLKSDYQSAKVAKALNDAKNAVQGIGEAVKDGAKSIGDLFKSPGTNDPASSD